MRTECECSVSMSAGVYKRIRVCTYVSVARVQVLVMFVHRKRLLNEEGKKLSVAEAVEIGGWTRRKIYEKVDTYVGIILCKILLIYFRVSFV